MNDIVFRSLIPIEAAEIDHKMRTNGRNKSRENIFCLIGIYLVFSWILRELSGVIVQNLEDQFI